MGVYFGKKKLAPVVIQDMKDFPGNKMGFIQFEVFCPKKEDSFWCIFPFLFTLSFIEMLFLCK